MGAAYYNTDYLFAVNIDIASIGIIFFNDFSVHDIIYCLAKLLILKLFNPLRALKLEFFTTIASDGVPSTGSLKTVSS